MPFLAPAPPLEPEPSDRFGRPPLADSDPDLAELAALWVDVAHWSTNDLARQLELAGGIDLEAARKRAHRLRDAGRERLARRGVCPWTVFRVPPGHWEQSRDLERWLLVWRRGAHLFPDPVADLG